MVRFEVGKKYSRADIKESIGIARSAKGSNWDTGIVEHKEGFFIFANVGTEGRTGHRHADHWEGALFQWYQKSQSRLTWPSVQRLLKSGKQVFVFWRTSNQDPFIFAGNAQALKVSTGSPVGVLWAFERDGEMAAISDVADEESGTHREGALRRITVNAYERDSNARRECIRIYGSKCSVCDLAFCDRYGAIGDGFIHVHHLVPLSEVGEEYELNPKTDLKPVCPNCHAMLHRR